MKIIILFIICSLLVGCRYNDVGYEIVQIYNNVYAVDLVSNNISLVNVEYEIKDEEDVFLLYTIYQNYLPLGFTSPACSNISLIDCYSNDYYTFYIVDNYIDFVEEIDIFRECITKTNKLYGFKDAIFLKNGYEVL